MSSLYYRLFSHLDAPKRYLSLTIDELMVAIFGFSCIALINQKLICVLFSLGLLSTLRLLKRGQTPKRLLILMYWYFPHGFTRFFLPKLPASHHRVYLA